MKRFLFSLLIFTASISSVFAADSGGLCKPMAPLKAAAEENGLKWIEVTNDQFRFLQGIFVVNPQTPPGLPYGDKAVLLQKQDDKGALVFFIDGDKVCEPMKLPEEAVKFLLQLNQVHHEGQDN